MDILTFIAEVVKAAAWPVAAIVIALLFREQLIALLKRLKKGKVGPAEFEFEETVKALKEEAAEIAPVTRLADVEKTTVTLIASNPRAAVLNAWLEVEVQATNLALKKGLIKPQHARNTSAVMLALQKSDVLRQPNVELLNHLRALRNKAAHELDFNPSIDSVLTYVQLARDLKDELEKAAH